MTVDPNKPADEPKTPDPALTIDDDPEEPKTPVAPAVDVDAIAEAVIGKLVKAAEAAPTPAAQPAATVSDPDIADYKEMRRVVDNNETTHPLYSTWKLQLAILARQGQEDEWVALGCNSNHPARALFAANPGAYAGQPKFAYQQWYIEASQKQQQDEKAKQEKEAKDKEARDRVRDSAPGMPSRSVGGSTRSGKALSMTHAEFNRRVETEPDLDDKYDQGLIVFTD